MLLFSVIKESPFQKHRIQKNHLIEQYNVAKNELAHPNNFDRSIQMFRVVHSPCDPGKAASSPRKSPKAVFRQTISTISYYFIAYLFM